MGAGQLITEKVVGEAGQGRGILVCGLPGSGYVGKLAADHLVDLFGLEKVAEYLSSDFPPQANVGEGGVAESPKGELYFAPRGGEGLYVFTADAQPSTSRGQYELADAVVGFAKKRGVDKVYALAAYITGSFSDSPRVFGSGTSADMLKALEREGVTLMKEGGISGMNGVLVGMASLRGLQGACLLGETSGYVVDAAASESVLETLSKVVGIPIDTSKLKEKAAETQKLISQIQSLSEQARESAPERKEGRPGYIG